MLANLNDLFRDHLKDLYSAERQLVKALPRMAKASNHPELRAAFESHLEETHVHVERLEEIAKLLEFKPSGKHCKGMEGLIEEGKELLEEEAAEAVLDAGLIGAAQKVEHYEISAYGTARAMADQRGLPHVAELLQKTLEEEDSADDNLTELSEGGILQASATAEEEELDGKSEETSSSRGSKQSKKQTTDKRGSK